MRKHEDENVQTPGPEGPAFNRPDRQVGKQAWQQNRAPQGAAQCCFEWFTIFIPPALLGAGDVKYAYYFREVSRQKAEGASRERDASHRGSP